MADSSLAARLLVVEDEYLIRMLLEDMLAELGYEIGAAVGSIEKAIDHANKGDFSAAILDVNLDGQEIFPVADILKERGVPFIFVTGYGEGSLPPNYRDHPTLQKPFQTDKLKSTLEGMLTPTG